MSLPEITLPGGLPCWLAEGHQGELQDVYAHVGMRTGHDRLRRVYTTAPERRRVALLLLEHQAPIFHDWFERDLLAGEREFSAHVANVAGGLAWWRARFADDPPYEAEPLQVAGGIGWRITATLLLMGEPSLEEPYTPDMIARNVIRLRASAVGTSFSVLEANNVIGLAAGVFDHHLEAHNVIGLQGTVSDHRLEAHNVVELVAEVS